MQDIITVNHLSKSYGSHQVLNDISFSFQPGQIIALLGPNGSGKTHTVAEFPTVILSSDE